MAMRGVSVGMGPKPIGESLLGISWHNTAQVPHLNSLTVMDYFANPSNPFYDRTCNNEIIKMQRLSPEHLASMTGIEYVVIHTQEPILYVIRKQSRQGPNHVVPLSDYYIIAGHVYQAPDLGTVINSRILNVVHHLESALEEAMSYSRYHPSKGYFWEFTKDHDSSTDKKKAAKGDKKVNEGSSVFQRQRVDMLLSEWSKAYPPKFAPPPGMPPAGASAPGGPSGPGTTSSQPDQQSGKNDEQQAAAAPTSGQPRPEGAQQFVGTRGADDGKGVQQPPEKRRRIE